MSKRTALGSAFHYNCEEFLHTNFSAVTVIISRYCLGVFFFFYTFSSFYFVPVLVLHRSGFASCFPTNNMFLSGVGAAFTCLETAFRLDALHRQMKLLGEDNPVSKLQVKLEPGIAFG